MKVFYDPTGLRWKWTTRIFLAVLIVLAVISYLILISIIAQRTLPALSLKQFQYSAPDKDNSKQKEIAANNDKEKKEISNNNQKIPVQNKTDLVSMTYKSQIMAYYADWDQNSLTSLENNAKKIDVLLPQWLNIDNDTLKLHVNNQENIKRVKEVRAKENPNMKIVAVLDNINLNTKAMDSGIVDSLMKNKTKQADLIREIKKFIDDNKLDGISIDFDNISKENQKNFLDFEMQLKTALGNKLLSVSLPLGNSNYQYQQLGEINDFILLKAYDEHWMNSDPGPIASHLWLQQKLAETYLKIPKDKLVISLGTYSYDWKEGEKNAEMISYAKAIQLAKDAGATIYFDGPNQNSNFEYLDENKKLHKVVILDAISAFNQKSYIQNFQPKGFAIWRLGYEDSSLWSVLMEKDRDKQLAGIENIPAIQAVDSQGTGDFMKIMPASAGVRKVSYDPNLNLITESVYENLPSGYVINKFGEKKDKTIALTFDDGPDPAYTPKILDILKKYDVKATFFVVGKNAVNNGELIRRIDREGHLIGNHTFTHPDISTISTDQMNMELNSTQLVIESILHKKSLLFRPPYDQDLNPTNIEQSQPINLVSKSGYFTVGHNIDPKDWNLPADNMVEETLALAEKNNGGILLLHDGGGDRNTTVEALPKIIEGLQKKGFQIVSLNELGAVPKEAFNPSTQYGDLLISSLEINYYKLMTGIVYFMQFLFYFSLIFGLFRFLFIGGLALIHKWRVNRQKFNNRFKPTVSVVIAAYNEEKVIKDTIESILKSDYDPNKYDIIIVNDGSTDKTWQVLKENYENHPRVKMFNKENGGKSAAINYGTQRATGDIIVSLDADTLMHPQTIRMLVRHFSNPKIGAVAGNAKVGNRVNMLTNFQALEYITCQNLDKRAFDMMNAITVVPGAIGAWRKDLVLKLGGLDDDTLAEDSDLTLQIIRNGYTVHYEEKGIAYTEAPMKLKALASQRYRWIFGTLQVLIKNGDIVFNPKYKGLGMIGLPNTLFFQFLAPLVTPIVDFSLLVQLLIMFYQFVTTGSFTPLGGLNVILFYYMVFNIFDYLSCTLAFTMEKRENWKLLLWLFPQRIFYRFLVNWLCLRSIYSAIKGQSVHWNKLERAGNLKKVTAASASVSPTAS